MPSKEVNTAIVAAAFVAVATVNHLKIRKQQRQIREDIRLETEKEIAAIKAAADTINEKIHAGHYNNKGINDLVVDSRFYRMIYRLEA